MNPADDWSPPRIVDPRAAEPVVLGEMADVRKSWRQQRRARLGRSVWPILVLVLVLVIIASGVLLSAVLRF